VKIPAFTRRHFLKSTIAAGATVTFSPLMFQLRGAETFAMDPASTPSWVDKPMRWAQLTLVEDDPGKFDVDFWLGYFKSAKCDSVCLSGGGCVAYYPTQIPLHHRSRWLGGRDVLGELIKGCRKQGMVVIVRTDPHATYDDAAEAHPDWIAVDASGNKRRHWASPEMWVTCGLGPYNFEFMTEVKKEIMTRYRVDGIFINRWEGSGMNVGPGLLAKMKEYNDSPASDSEWPPTGERCYGVSGRCYVWIKFTNTGTETWIRGLWGRQANLGLNRDDKEPYRLGMAADWLWDDRIATTTTLAVAPGEVGEFRFKVRAPIARGVYRLNLRPVIDGTVWLEDQGVFWIIDVR